MVVGGIVIMNIMLASVTERTRESASAARSAPERNTFCSSFMTESSVLAATGGLLGVIFAYLIVLLGRSTTSIPMEMQTGAVITRWSYPHWLDCSSEFSLQCARRSWIQLKRCGGRVGRNGTSTRRKPEAGNGHAAVAQTA